MDVFKYFEVSPSKHVISELIAATVPLHSPIMSFEKGERRWHLSILRVDTSSFIYLLRPPRGCKNINPGDVKNINPDSVKNIIPGDVKNINPDNVKNIIPGNVKKHQSCLEEPY